jgi:AcrR family transcriptional regulator
MGKRQAAVDETKRRIIEAAIVEYGENGIEGTSMQAIARRADVAPGTVLYHYPDPDDLAEVVVQSMYQRYAAPSVDSIPADQPIEVRVGTLIGELYSVYDRTGEAYRIYEKSHDHPAMRKANSDWERTVGEMMMRALGDRAGDREAVAIVSVLVNPGFRGNLLAAGFSAERAVEAATRLALAWLD